MREEGQHLNRRLTSISKGKPYIILKWAQTQDHFIAKMILIPNGSVIPIPTACTQMAKRERVSLLAITQPNMIIPNYLLKLAGPSPTRVVIDPK